MKFGLSPKASANLIVIGLIVISVWFAFIPGDGYKRTVEEQGYTEVTIAGYSLFGCPEKEYGFNFKAIKDGKQFKGVVCRTSLFFGSYNIRQY
jgi:hypothetical protein